jgi:hypothetical protein
MTLTQSIIAAWTLAGFALLLADAPVGPTAVWLAVPLLASTVAWYRVRW